MIVMMYPKITIRKEGENVILNNTYTDVILHQDEDLFIENTTLLQELLQTNDTIIEWEHPLYQWCNLLFRHNYIATYVISNKNRNQWLALKEDEEIFTWTKNKFCEEIASFLTKEEAEEMISEEDEIIQIRLIPNV